MDFEHLLYETDGPRVTITLNRPEKINALNEPLTREFETAMLAAEDDYMIKVVVLKGARRGFCSGHDYSKEHFVPGERETGAATEAHRIDFSKRLRAYMRVWEIPKPVIAQVHGPVSPRAPCWPDWPTSLSRHMTPRSARSKPHSAWCKA